MTVYNGAPFLRDAIESILNQTYAGFKFLIVDNASTDDSREIIKSYNDPRIELVALPENIGQVPALNKGLSLIDTPLVARMDADDISLPNRLEKQVDFMDKHPDVAISGSFIIVFTGKKETIWKYPLHSDDIKVKLFFECCLPHPALIYRKTLLDQYNLKYDETLKHSEDWDLFQRTGKYFQLANIPDILFKYRIHNQSVTRNTFDRQYPAAVRIDDVSLDWLGLKTHPLRNIHRDVAYETLNIKNREPLFLDNVLQWFDTLKQANFTHNVFSQSSLETFLKERLFIVLTNNTIHGSKAFEIFKKEKLFRYVPLSWSLKFIIKTVLKKKVPG